MPASEKKNTNRYFNGVETRRLIVTIESKLVSQVDDLIGTHRYGNIHHPCRRNRAEFVRQAIAEKLERDSTTDSRKWQGAVMLDRESLEMTVLQMARIQGEKLDRHTLYAVRNEIRNALAAKERYRRTLEAPPYQWKKPRPPR